MQQEIIRFQIFLQKNNEIFFVFTLFYIFSKKMLFSYMKFILFGVFERKVRS
jgi:hypothetical protein